VTDRISVVIADDQAATRTGIRQALEPSGFDVRAEVQDADRLLRIADEQHADVYLVDVALSGDGIKAAVNIREARPDSTIVMLTASPSGAELVEALHAGAIGYLPKDIEPSRLAFAVRDAHGGAPAIPRRLTGRIIEELRTRPDDRGRLRLTATPRKPLSDREWEMLERLHRQQSTDEIASQLSLSPVTVRRHISSLVKKLGVANRAAAIALVDERTPAQTGTTGPGRASAN